jgi:hypothetical protein
VKSENGGIGHLGFGSHFAKINHFPICALIKWEIKSEYRKAKTSNWNRCLPSQEAHLFTKWGHYQFSYV